MARTYLQEFPERHLMGVISDLLGIRHFSTSNGSTVRRDFLEEVAVGLGISPEYAARLSTKDDVLRVVIETATHSPMDEELFSRGHTVTNKALRAVVDGILVHGAPGRPPVPTGEPEDLADGEIFPEFDPETVVDERNRRLMAVATREGRDRFRSALIEAYDGRCAITGCDSADTLQAAHIYPYRGQVTNHLSNGLLLRADIHLLFDKGAFGVDERDLRLLPKPHLMLTSYRDDFRPGSVLRAPRARAARPSPLALRSHREWAGL